MSDKSQRHSRLGEIYFTVKNQASSYCYFIDLNI